MQVLLTEAEYNNLIHYKNQYNKADGIGKKHVELLVKFNELKQQHLALKTDYNKLISTFNHKLKSIYVSKQYFNKVFPQC